MYMYFFAQAFQEERKQIFTIALELLLLTFSLAINFCFARKLLDVRNQMQTVPKAQKRLRGAFSLFRKLC